MVQKKDQIEDIKVVEVGNIPNATLKEEIERADELHRYYIVQPVTKDGDESDLQSADMAWFEDSQRAAVVWYRQAEWFYADSPEEAAQKWLAGEVNEDANPREQLL